MSNLMRLPGARLVAHAAFFLAIFLVLMWFMGGADPLTMSNVALAAMYATAMFGMVILVGLSGQVSLGNGALMAVGAYTFALVSMNWATVPIIGVAMNGWWAMGFALVGGIVFGLVIGGLGARLKGPYLAGLTLGIAVGIPAIANRFPDLFGGETGLLLTVPYPEGGYLPEPEEGFEEIPVDEATAGTETGTETLPTEGEGADETLAPEDLLTVEDLGGDAAASDAASPEVLPTEGEGADESLAPEDLLTVDDLAADGSAIDASPTDVPSADVPVDVPADIPVDTLPPSTDMNDPGFLIEYWQVSLALIVACFVGFVALNLVRGRQGIVWRAVRDDPVAAAVSGISPAWAKVSAFMISSVFAALAGGVFAQLLSYVGPGAFPLGLSLSLLVGVVLGGRSSLLGAVIGALIIVWLPNVVRDLSDGRGWDEQVTNNMPNLLYGLLVVLVVLVAPGGIVGSIMAGVAKLRRTRREVEPPAAAIPPAPAEGHTRR
ncbi:MAG: branched-chain amino acid ABC transporter permease [Actinomycetota bacterium]|nr:branched-chain amino acid ABC transporter permease [Actinomycetota bacterium]